MLLFDYSVFGYGGVGLRLVVVILVTGYGDLLYFLCLCGLVCWLLGVIVGFVVVNLLWLLALWFVCCLPVVGGFACGWVLNT